MWLEACRCRSGQGGGESDESSGSASESESSVESGGFPRSMSDWVEGLKRDNLVRPQEGEDEAQVRLDLFRDLDEHDELNRSLTATYNRFGRAGASPRGWQDIPSSAAQPRRVVFMFLVVDSLYNDAWWTAWFEQADQQGHRNDYSIVYHRGSAYGKTAGGPEGRRAPNDLLAERGLPVLPPTKTGWARTGLVRATLLLLRFGLELPDAKWFVLVSDSCMPLYTFHDFYQRIQEVEQSRFNDFGVTIDVALSRHIWQTGTCTGPRRSRKADQWATWVRGDAEFFVRSNHLLQLKPRAVFVDEPYFINLMDEHERPYENVQTTYMEWYHTSDLPSISAHDKKSDLLKMAGSPHTFRLVDMKTIFRARGRGCWFMRKVGQGADYPTLDELELEDDDVSER